MTGGERMGRTWVVLFSFAAVLVSLGCPRTPDKTAVVIELEPMYFTLLKSGDSVEVKNFDLQEMFDRAGKLFEAGRCSEAKRLYMAVASSAPEASTRGLALFNAALCELALGKPGASVALLEQAEKLVDPEEGARVAVLKMQALVELGRFEEVLRLGEVFLKDPLAAEFAWSAHTSMAAAMAVDGEYTLAEEHLHKALALLLEHTPIPEQYRNREIARVYFKMGLIYRDLFNHIEFHLPVERMTVDMTDKLAILRHAEELFLACVRLREPNFSPRAGIQIARLYEGFAISLLQAEVPTDLTELELQVYQEELNARVIPFLQRAAEIFGRTVNLCATNRFPAQWLKRASAGKDRVEQQIESLKRTIQ